MVIKFISFDNMHACLLTHAYLTPTAPECLLATVDAGCMLYLPAHWYHEVHQEGDGRVCDDSVDDDDDSGPSSSTGDHGGLCIAVNYWWDAPIDQKPCWLDFVDRIKRL